MPQGKHFLNITLGIVFLGMGAALSLAADPQNEPLPVGENTGKFGYSVPEIAPAPEPETIRTTAGKPTVFPYGAPLVGYESACTCWHHHYCKCKNSTCKRRAQCRAWGYPEEFCERPFGTYVRSHFHSQITNGLADQLVIYQYDFFDVDTEKASQFKPRGLRQINEVAKISTMLFDGYYPITVESTGNPELDHQRRIQVFEKLAELGAPVTLDQVVSGHPTAVGLDGVEAFEIYQNQIQQTKQHGGSVGGSRSIGIGLAPRANSRAR